MDLPPLEATGPVGGVVFLALLLGLPFLAAFFLVDLGLRLARLLVAVWKLGAVESMLLDVELAAEADELAVDELEVDELDVDVPEDIFDAVD